MATTKIQSGAFPADVVTTAAIDDLGVTHAKLHTTMDLSSKTVTLPTLSTLTTTGNVGIGNDSPSAPLHIKKSISSTYTGGNTGIVNSLFNITNTLSTSTVNAQANIQLGVYDGTHNRVTGIAAVAESATNRKASLVFWTDDENTRSEKLRITGDGNVGIGTADPAHKFHINQPGNSPQMRISGNANWDFYSYNDTNFYVNNASGTVLGLLGNRDAYFGKNLSIGDAVLSTYHTSYPALDLGSSASVQGYTGNNGVWLQSNLFMNTNGQWTSKSNDYSAMLELYDGNFHFYNTASGTGTRTLLTPMVIKQNGNVGIGTSSPDSLLHLQKTRTGTISGGASDTGAVIKLHTEAQWESGYGNNAAASTNDYLGSIEFSTGDGSNGEGVRAAIRGTVDSYYNQNSIVFETAAGAAAGDPIERMRVLHNGNIGIGTAAPGAPLHIEFSNNDGGVGGLLVKNSNTGTTSNFSSLSTQAVNGTIQGTFGAAHYPSWGGSGTFAGSQTSHPFRIITGNSVRATIDQDGYTTMNNPRMNLGTNYNARTGKTGLRIGRTVYNWFNYGINGGGTYLHIKTNLANTGANPQATMSSFHIRGYTYAGDTIDSILGFHNWSGTYHAQSYRNNGSRTVVSSSYGPYTSTDNKVVIVLNIGSTYPGISIDYMQNFEYTWRDVEVSTYSKSSSTSGVY